MFNDHAISDYGINHEMRRRQMTAAQYLNRQDRERGKVLRAQRRFIIVNAVVVLVSLAVCMAVVGAFYPTEEYHHGPYLASIYGGAK